MYKAFFLSPLTIAELTACISHHYPTWQVCFLNNQHAPVIGILPKISWRLQAQDTAQDFVLTTTKRHISDDIGYQHERTNSDYAHFLTVIENYSQQNYQATPASPNDAIVYHEGLMGFVGYDIAAHALSHDIVVDNRQPAAFFGHYDIYISPCVGGFELIGNDADLGILPQIASQLCKLTRQDLPTATALQLTALWSKQDYLNAFEQVQRYLHAGDGYQINLTQVWQSNTPHQRVLAAHLPCLMSISNAPFAGFVDCGDFELLSISPELFFSFYQQDDGIHIITKPIKGTRPRAINIQHDNQLKTELATSDKDIAENLMIVDLLRNDLGKYAFTGSVKTPHRFAIESFHNVHHMVSTITAHLHPDNHPLSVLFGSLPAGSITGTPKKRACQIIAELEALPRGAYCGTLGFINFDGTGRFNVLIRTLQANASSVSVWAGGGITVRSDALGEYQECWDKISTILDALQSPQSSS
ncbi:anthranilate synthase component I family protein [Moraxella cuniculi]|uniref:Para-aminobenzoate synthase component 1 n=1 Tax=Moraxella cuniculi TaxID=34061 RepID=A0A3S4RKJ4_9GAMM|nr:chorismate-binding protein [Moraxella cuniculi]VEG12835.1 Para-aminobenzoate synthase component 1 [Moraxella cuniculi]